MSNIKNLYSMYENELNDIARAHTIPVATILAVLQVETNDDDGFATHPDGNSSLIIRFELHKFKKYCKKSIWDGVHSQFSWDKDMPWTKQMFRMYNEDEFKSFHGNQFNEYFVLENCREMDEHAAFMSISMGLPQVMGFNYQQLGYSSPRDMYNDFSLGTVQQIEGMMKFMSKAMKKRLRERRFIDFAEMYNGRGKAEDYGNKIRLAESEIADWVYG